MVLSNIFLQATPTWVNQSVDLAIMGFSLVLFAIAISSYRSTKIKKVGIASIAFLLFAIQLFLEYMEDLYSLFEENLDLILSLITLGILILFFFAVIKKR